MRHQELLNRIETKEIDQIAKSVQELDFVEPQTFQMMHLFRINDATAKIQMADEVTKEFKSGVYDPKLSALNEKMFKKKKKERLQNSN